MTPTGRTHAKQPLAASGELFCAWCEKGLDGRKKKYCSEGCKKSWEAECWRQGVKAMGEIIT